MTRAKEERLLEYLEGTLDEAQRDEIRQQLEADPELSAELEKAAAGLEALQSIPAAIRTTVNEPARGRVSIWAVAVAIGATLAVAIPATLYLASDRSEVSIPAVDNQTEEAPEFVLVLRGRWLDDVQLAPEEFQERVSALQRWTGELAASGVLIAATDLAVEQGVRYGAGETLGDELARQAQDPDYVVGVLTLRMEHYHEALAAARSCPHLQYGGSVTVRRVGAGFFTISGRRDFTE